MKGSCATATACSVAALNYRCTDMYTFDADLESARKTYDAVCAAYTRLFNRLHLPTVRCSADTGFIGGHMSEEFHAISPLGEDRLFVCSKCGAASNLECTRALPASLSGRACTLADVTSAVTMVGEPPTDFFLRVSHVAGTAVVHLPGDVPCETLVQSVLARHSRKVTTIVDRAVGLALSGREREEFPGNVLRADSAVVDIVRQAQAGDVCGECNRQGETGPGVLEERSGMEIGHAFLLGDKYSAAFEARYESVGKGLLAYQMGCYGIGVSRLFAMLAEVHASKDALFWPANVAPFRVCIVPASEAHLSDAVQLVERIVVADRRWRDWILLDDRFSRDRLPKRLSAIEQLGIPALVVVGGRAASASPNTPFEWQLRLSAAERAPSRSVSEAELLVLLKTHVVEDLDM
jgi:prolyl-tRNA synthetase